jgi:hypothetical protein
MTIGTDFRFTHIISIQRDFAPGAYIYYKLLMIFSTLMAKSTHHFGENGNGKPRK